MTARRIILRGADIITPDRVVTDGSLVIEDGRIAAVLQATPPPGGEEVLWVTGLIAPGLIDLHSDALEKEIRPRPSAVMPLGLALMEFDRKLAGHGICTVVHAVSFTETDGNARAHEEGEAIAGAIGQGASAFLVRHLVQARYEVTDMGAAPAVHRVIEAGLARMVSFMDHAPGGRQVKTVSEFVSYYTRALGLDREVVHRLAKEKHRRKREEASHLEAVAAELAESARRHCALLASHDDEAASHVAWARRLGVTIAEFPVSVEAVAAAKAGGLRVVMGAPNLLRGGSASGNLSALEVFRRGLLDGLCSDYYPASLACGCGPRRARTGPIGRGVSARHSPPGPSPRHGRREWLIGARQAGRCGRHRSTEGRGGDHAGCASRGRDLPGRLPGRGRVRGRLTSLSSIP